jgi:Transposase DDE domain group 1
VNCTAGRRYSAHEYPPLWSAQCRKDRRACGWPGWLQSHQPGAAGRRALSAAQLGLTPGPEPPTWAVGVTARDGLFRQAVFGRLAGYEDVNDAERLARDPAMCAIVGRDGFDRAAASSSQMGRFATGWLATDANLAALTDLSGTWIDRVHARKPPERIILDMDSSESPTHGEQEGSAWNGHFSCTCYHPLFLFNQFGDLECCRLRPGNVHGAEDWRLC